MFCTFFGSLQGSVFETLPAGVGKLEVVEKIRRSEVFSSLSRGPNFLAGVKPRQSWHQFEPGSLTFLTGFLPLEYVSGCTTAVFNCCFYIH